MAFTEQQHQSVERPSSASFVVVATSEQFNDRVAAMHEAIVDNFGRDSVTFAPGFHTGLHFANVTTAEGGEHYYELEERIRRSRPLAVHAMRELIKTDFRIELDRPEAVGSNIMMPVLNEEHLSIMRRFFVDMAQVGGIAQPTTSSIESIILSSFLSDEELQQITHFTENQLLIQPIKQPFSSFQLWESSTDIRRPSKIVDTISTGQLF